MYFSFSDAWPKPFDDFKNLLFYSGSGLVFLYCLFRDKNLKIPFWPALLFLIYIFFALLSIQIPIYEGFLAWARLLLWGGLAWSFSRCSGNERLYLMKAAVLSAALIGVLGILWVFEIRFVAYSAYMVTPIGWVAYYGDFMALHLPMVFYLFESESNRKKKILWFGCLVLILTGLWISGSRASILGFAAAFFWMVMRWRRWKWIAFAVMVVFALAFFLPKSLQDNSVLKRWTYTSDMTNGRWINYLVTADMITAKPWRGWGMGSYRFIFPEFAYQRPGQWVQTEKEWYVHPHNELLHQWSETGFLGLLAFVSFWSFLLWRGVRLPRSPQMVSAVAGLLIVLVSWQFSTAFLNPLIRALTAFYVGWMLQQISCRTVTVKQIRPVLFFIGGAAIFFVTAYNTSLYAYWKSRTAPDDSAKKEWARRAHSLAPLAFDSLYVYVDAFLREPPFEKGQAATRQLYREFPFVPSVLYQTASLKIQEKKPVEAIVLLDHALRNAPGFDLAENVRNYLKRDLKKENPPGK
ncbi:MAG: O-antigen ligase family protein [Deltaproteobacteria bacterium]|nr:O-antigen ligase family protein [Deltaproteobacteria bacterium]